MTTENNFVAHCFGQVSRYILFKFITTEIIKFNMKLKVKILDLKLI